MALKSRLIFENNPDLIPENSHPDSPKDKEPYIASQELQEAVNLAIYLGRPLLIEGEAGCGKTKLAHAVAYQLGLPFYRWDVRSTTKAREGLYEYDAILRLHDVETSKLNNKINEGRNPANPKDYRTFGALGKAFTADRPAVVLIDEIDKADVDFPNDLLTVLDKPMRFEIRETGETGDKAIQAKHEPIVIITSNKEKGDLPAPFLRRCLYFYLKFPTEEQLKKIVDIHYSLHKESLGKAPNKKLKDAAVNLFFEIRQDSPKKLPGTSEFLDWLHALQSFKEKPYPVDDLSKVIIPYPMDDSSKVSIPYPELLFKLRQDWQKYTTLPVAS